MSDIYNDHRTAELKSHSEILALATALSADGIYYSEREQLINDLESRRFQLTLVVDRVSNTYSSVPDDVLRDGRTIQGDIEGTEIEIKIQLPNSLNEQADALSRGDTYKVEGIVNRWVSGLDQFELWGLVPSESDSAPSAEDPQRADSDDGDSAPDVVSGDAALAEPAQDDGEAIEDVNGDDIEALEEGEEEKEEEDDPAESLSHADLASESEVEDDSIGDAGTEETSEEFAAENEASEVSNDLSEEEVVEDTAGASPDENDGGEIERRSETEESEPVQDMVMGIVGGLPLKEQFAEAFAEPKKEASNDASEYESETGDSTESSDQYNYSTQSNFEKRITNIERSRARSKEFSKQKIIGGLIAVAFIGGIAVILVFANEIFQDSTRNRRMSLNSQPIELDKQAGRIVYERASSSANDTDHITWLVSSGQMHQSEAVRVLATRTPKDESARKTIVQYFAVSPVDISKTIHDELMNAPIEFVAPLFNRLKRAMSHPWSTPKHKPLLADVIKRIEEEGASLIPPPESDAEENPSDGAETIEPNQMARAKELAAFFFDKLDTNSDGIIDSDEIENADNPGRAGNSDRNGDGKITLDELVDETYRKIDANPDVDFSK